MTDSSPAKGSRLRAAVQPQVLRQEAEAVVKGRSGLADSGERSRKAVQHELDVHQVELEMQNEALRATHAELEESRDRYYELYDLAPVGYVTLDAAGTVHEANLRAAQTLGVTRNLLVGRPLAAFMTPQAADALHLHLRDVFAGGERQVCALEFQGQGPLSGSSVPVRLESQAHTRAAGGECRCALIDLSDLRREQEARRASEAQLHQAQKLEAIGTLASGVAHDFNNLLMGIRSCASIALSKLQADNPVRTYLDEIRQATVNGAETTRHLLAFGRAQGDTPSVFQMNVLVVRTQRLLQRLLGDDIEVRVNLVDDDSRVRANPAQLEQVLVNLAVNARHAMPTGGTLSIETSRSRIQGSAPSVLAAGEYVVLAVTDTGTGMSEETRQRVFEPFFTTKAKLGTGLGLSMAHGVVQRAGGHIRVQSQLGVGSCFEVLLPHVDEPESHIFDAPEEVEAPSTGGTILLVEDEALVRMGTRFYLERAGYRVLEASTGPEAVECCAKYPGHIDLLLTDVVLPGMGGRDIAREVREVRPQLPVLFMSAHPAHVLIGQGRLSEHASLLQKPFGSGALIRRVADLLADAKGSSSALLAPGYAPANRGASASPPQPRGTVLVLEDEPSARTAICEYLRDIGWTVIEAAGAEEAILGAQSQPIDVLLADYRLPGATGDVIARRVLDLHPDSSVVYMSGFPELDLDPPGPVLAKPLDLDEVGEAVQAARAVGEGPVLECPDPAAK